jgi:type VI secretion system secreted protein VgrG
MSNELQAALRGNRPDYVLGTPLEGWAGPQVVRWRSREAIGELFCYEIVLRRLVDEGPFTAYSLLNGPATLRIATETRWREVHGIVASVEELDRTSELALYGVRLVPAFFRATQRLRSRTFVDQTLGDILAHVLENRSHDEPLGRGGLSSKGASGQGNLAWDHYEPPEERYRIDVADTARLQDPQLRAYTVQYNESDFAFLNRLLEEEGLSFVIDQEPGASTLRITDLPGSPSAFEGEDVVPFRHSFKGVGAKSRECVRALKRRASLQWGSVEVRDFDPARPQAPQLGLGLDTPLTGGETEPDQSVFLERRYPSRDEAVSPPCVTPAALAQQRKAVQRSMQEAIGTHRALVAGLRFQLRDDSGVHSEQELVCIAVSTFATQLLPEETSLDFEPFGLFGRKHDAPIYENALELLPAELTFRPELRTPRPRIDGVHTAVVSAEEASSPPEIHRNERGDVRLRFPWDERVEPGRPSSTWVRVSQAWAGAGYGHIFTPRVGQEVLVAYMNGDPDRPLVVGRVHNAIQPVEYDKPTISTIKTKSSPNSDGFNELRFDDDAGKEEVFIHAQRNLNEVVLANHSTSVGGNQSNSVGGNQSDAVDGDQSNTVKGNRTHAISGTEDVTVTKDATTSYVARELHLVGETRSTVITGVESLWCDSGRISTIMGSEVLNVQGVRNMVVSGPNSEHIGGPLLVTSPICTQIHSALFKVSVGGSSLTITPGSIRLKVGGASICMTAGSITVDASAIEISGESVGVESEGTLTLQGNTVNLVAPAVFNARSGAIKLNG